MNEKERFDKDLEYWRTEIEVLKEKGCGLHKYLYYTKGYLCNGKDFLCDECYYKIVGLSERIKKERDAFQEKQE